MIINNQELANSLFVMRMRKLFIILWMLLPMAGWAQGPVTIKQVMDEMHRTRDVNFVYDSSLNVGQAYRGPDVKSLSLKEALQRLFRDSGIGYTVKGKRNGNKLGDIINGAENRVGTMLS